MTNIFQSNSSMETLFDLNDIDNLLVEEDSNEINFTKEYDFFPPDSTYFEISDSSNSSQTMETDYYDQIMMKKSYKITNQDEMLVTVKKIIDRVNEKLRKKCRVYVAPFRQNYNIIFIDGYCDLYHNSGGSNTKTYELNNISSLRDPEWDKIPDHDDINLDKSFRVEFKNFSINTDSKIICLVANYFVKKFGRCAINDCMLTGIYELEYKDGRKELTHLKRGYGCSFVMPLNFVS